ncbi:MAG: hypothetical protein ACOC4M_08380 [Promethearchaeia archaeon]
MAGKFFNNQVERIGLTRQEVWVGNFIKFRHFSSRRSDAFSKIRKEI